MSMLAYTVVVKVPGGWRTVPRVSLGRHGASGTGDAGVSRGSERTRWVLQSTACRGSSSGSGQSGMGAELAEHEVRRAPMSRRRLYRCTILRHYTLSPACT